MEALSIRGLFMGKTYYQLLAVPADAGFDEIRRAFRREVRRCHPDTAAPEMADEAHFQELLAAYRTLGSPAKRANYDARLSRTSAATSDSLLRKLRKRCNSRWHGLKAIFRLAASISAAQPSSIRKRSFPAKFWVRHPSSGPTFVQVLAARQQAEISNYVLCEDGVIRKKKAADAGKRGRPMRPHRAHPTVALRSWWAGLLVLLIGVWEVFRQ